MTTKCCICDNGYVLFGMRMSLNKVSFFCNGCVRCQGRHDCYSQERLYREIVDGKKNSGSAGMRPNGDCKLIGIVWRSRRGNLERQEIRNVSFGVYLPFAYERRVK